MIYDWTTEIDITEDNVLKIAVPSAIEGEIVQGDRLRVRVIVEEVLVDGEEEQLKDLVQQLERDRLEHPEDFEMIPWEEVKAEMEKSDTHNGDAREVPTTAEKRRVA